MNSILVDISAVILIILFWVTASFNDVSMGSNIYRYKVLFLVSAYMMGFLSERKAQSSAEIFLCSFVSMVPVYIMGAGYFMLITKFFLKESIDFFYVLNYYALIFIPGDIVKCIIVGLAGAKIRRRI